MLKQYRFVFLPCCDIGSQCTAHVWTNRLTVEQHTRAAFKDETQSGLVLFNVSPFHIVLFLFPTQIPLSLELASTCSLAILLTVENLLVWQM